MVEKLDQFEVQREISLMLDSFEKAVAREIMVGLAARYGFELKDKAASSNRSFKPYPSRKRTH